MFGPVVAIDGELGGLCVAGGAGVEGTAAGVGGECVGVGEGVLGRLPEHPALNNAISAIGASRRYRTLGFWHAIDLRACPLVDNLRSSTSRPESTTDLGKDGAMRSLCPKRRHNVRRRASALIALLVTGALAAGCTSGSGGRAPAAGSTPGALPGTPVPASEFTDRLARGVAALTTAHLQMQTRLSGQLLAGSGDVHFTGGAVDAADVEQQLPAGLGQIEVVLAGGTTYAKLPPSFRTGKSAWSVVDGSHTGGGIGSLGTVISGILALVTPHGLITLADAASSITESNAGAHTTRYALRVDPSKLGAGSAALAGGTRPIVLHIALDNRDRPTQVAGSLDLLGQRVSPRVVLSRFGEAVSITAPKI